MAQCVIVIGAGAAGLAAARAMRDAGADVVVLEARGRLGGRAWTDTSWAGTPLEFGAEFIHGERAITHQYAARAGIATPEVERFGTGMYWADQAGAAARRLADLEAPERALIERLQAAYAALGYNPGPPDISLADALRRRGFGEPEIAKADVLLAQTWCAQIERLSRDDLVRELRVDRAGSREFRLRGGYRHLFDALAYGLDIRLDTRVATVRRHAGRVDVETAQGLYSADTCVVTLPVGVLQAGSVRFDPPFSQRKQQAIAAFDVEPATKLIYRFGRRHWDDALTYLCHTGLVARWWTPGFGRDDASNSVLVAYVTAARARRLDAMPEHEALATGLRELADLLGNDAVGADCIAARRVSWAEDPFARGGYAAVPPGAVWAREALAASEGNTLVFAGEACAYWTNPQTIHGAIESGLRAAQQCFKSSE